MKERQHRPNVVAKCEAVVDRKVGQILESLHAKANEINTHPDNFDLANKQKVASELNWALALAMRGTTVGGRFVVAKLEGQGSEVIFLQNDD